MKIISKKIIFAIISCLLVIGAFLLNFSPSTARAASDYDTVYVEKGVITYSGLAYATVYFKGKPGDIITVEYKSFAGSAIPGVDYQNSSSTVTATIKSNGSTSVDIPFKCLNTSSNREDLRVIDSATYEMHGRYFHVTIDDVTGVDSSGNPITVLVEENKRTCKVYLPYNETAFSTIGTTSYLNDYANMVSQWNAGTSEIDGQATWKSWEAGMDLDNYTTRDWVTKYINKGYAEAYTSFLIRYLSDTSVWSSSNIFTYAGSQQMISNYYRSKDVPGLYLYVDTEPCTNDFWTGNERGYQINGRAMYLISQNKNPWDDSDPLVDVENRKIAASHKTIYWFQNTGTWYAGAGAHTYSEFYKINPYNGRLNTGIAVFNDNSSWDRSCKDVYLFMKLEDDKAPSIVANYVDDSMLGVDGKLRFCIRFSEPVYLTNENDSIEVRYNYNATPHYATYKEGNYSDTLVFEIDAPSSTIYNVKYRFTAKVSDMSYHVDSYKKIKNNTYQDSYTDREPTLINGSIYFDNPQLVIDKGFSSNPAGSYELYLSVNGNGEKNIKNAIVYYKWSKESTIDDKTNKKSYTHNHHVTSDDNGSMSISLVSSDTDVSGSGTYYLHAYVVTGYGKSQTETFGPYALDVDPPKVMQKHPSRNDLKTKILDVEIENTGECVSNIDRVDIFAKYKRNGEMKTVTKTLVDGGLIVPGLSGIVSQGTNAETGNTTYVYKSNIDETNTDIPIDTFITGIMGENPRMNLEIGFVAYDAAGNFAKSDTFRLTYDIRDSFKVITRFPSYHYEPITDIEMPYAAYDISRLDDNSRQSVGIEIDLDDSFHDQVDGVNTFFRVYVNDKEVPYEHTSESIYSVKISDLNAGYYELLPMIEGTADDSPVELVSDPIRFYLTNGMKDETVNKTNASSNLVLTNKAFQLNDVTYYYLDSGGSRIYNFRYGAKFDDVDGRYVGGSPYPTFSNSTEAKKYIKYMEYQDMYLVSLTANMASMLNSGTGSTVYVKAANETTSAQEGQLWIKYKKSTWTPDSSSYGWAFYFYGNGDLADGININRLSTNLNNAINTVVNKIVSTGSTVYLVEDDTLNARTGAPFLSTTQMHVVKEVATKTLMGNPFVNNPTYDGDSGLYVNNYTVDDVSYPIATNLILSMDETTLLYYKYYESNTWTQINADDGEILQKVFADESGIYTIREYNSTGISEFNIYYDKSLPIIRALSNESELILDGTNSMFAGTSFEIKSFETEADSLAFVAILSYPSKRLLTVLYPDSFTTGESFSLQDGNYYIKVGDRSGNIVMYTVLLSLTTLDVTLSELESQSGVVVKVANREDNEIYSYEVYCNDELISSSYKTSQVFKDPGIYRVIVTDIYGNTVTKTLTYEFQSPQITWYYMNSDETYSKFNPEKIVSMYISEDESSSRTTNVYTSSRVRLQFNTRYGDSAVKFEITGIDSNGYAYAPETDSITIKDLSAFTIRVWFEDYPENDHMYVVRIDREAPIVNATFIGTLYEKKSEIDALVNAVDENKEYVLSANDPIILSTLDYDIVRNQTMNFESGDIIAGNHISFSMNDPSGIRDIIVTRDGQLMNLALDAENKLLINNYGHFVVMVSDTLGNTTTFTFDNVKESISSCQVDSNYVDEKVINYGNTDVVVSNTYPGTSSFLIKVGELTYNYDVIFDGQTVKYGQYYLTVEDVNNEIYRRSSFIENSSFKLDRADSSTRAEKCYTIIDNDDFALYVKFTEKYNVVYRVECKEKDIDVETLFSVGNNKLPQYYHAVLSKVASTVDIYSGNTVAMYEEGQEYVYIADTMTIGKNISELITSITVAYSVTTTFPEATTIYKDGAWLIEDYKGLIDGFYLVTVNNRYSNVTSYTVSKSKVFMANAELVYVDGQTVTVVPDNNTVYSNKAINLSVFSKSVYFKVTDEDGTETTSSGFYDNGVTSLEISIPGKYTVEAINSNGLSQTYKIEIASDNRFTYVDGWLTGFNENALRKDEYYTNTKVSVSLEEGIEYVEVRFNDTKTVIYDAIANSVDNDPSKLVECVGLNGNGEYTVCFRNKYGDVATRVVHYSATPELQLSRKTVSGKSFETMDLNYVLENNFYSNYILRFSTTSSLYQFKINNENINLDEPKTLEFTNSSGYGEVEYNISYLDEYGNNLSFKAILYRKNIFINTDQMSVITLKDELYTKDNVVITFEGDSTYIGTVSINNSIPEEYESGKIMYRDGKYTFTVKDIAGNEASYTITHKSVNVFSITNQATEETIMNGGVVNDSAVIFAELDGDSYIKTVVKDGILLSNYDSKRFNTTGFWELLVEDSIGNRSYVSFYIVNNSVATFNYEAPYGYTVGSVWYTNPYGQRSETAFSGDKITLEEDGSYAVIVNGIDTLDSYNFTVEIDNKAPEVQLVGVEDGGITPGDVTLSGLKNGDIVEIYRNDELMETLNVSSSSETPQITTGGKYRVVVTNVQGVSVEFNFERKHIANAAGSVLVIIVCLAITLGVGVGLYYHTKLKTDK